MFMCSIAVMVRKWFRHDLSAQLDDFVLIRLLCAEWCSDVVWAGCTDFHWNPMAYIGAPDALRGCWRLSVTASDTVV
jgi:hypothetical protein